MWGGVRERLDSGPITISRQGASRLSPDKGRVDCPRPCAYDEASRLAPCRVGLVGSVHIPVALHRPSSCRARTRAVGALSDTAWAGSVLFLQALWADIRAGTTTKLAKEAREAERQGGAPGGGHKRD